MTSRSTRIKKVVRWLSYLLAAAVLILVIAVLSIDPIVKNIAQKRIKAETGLVAEIGHFHIGFYDQSLTVRDLKLLNPPEFGGGILLDLPELHVAYDLEAMRSNIVHLRMVKVDMAQLHIVEKKDGKRNIDVFAKGTSQKNSHPAGGNNSTNVPVKMPQLPFQFGGIDKLQISLGETKYSNERDPRRSFEQQLGIKNEEFKDIKNEQDLQTVGIVIALKAGVANLWQEKNILEKVP